jgi:hypothetical protein
MKFFRRYIILSFLVIKTSFLSAQNITGIWEGYMTGEFIQINIEQRTNALCGYTYDYLLDDKADHCVAALEGNFNVDKKIWFLTGKNFIENSGTHVLMRIMLWHEDADGKNMLRGKVFTQSTAGSFLGIGGDDILVKRVSSKPQELGSIMAPCFPKAPKPATKKPVPAIPQAPKTTVTKPITPTVTNVRTQPIIKKPEVSPTLKVDSINRPALSQGAMDLPKTAKEMQGKMNARKKSEQSRLIVDVKKIHLKVYDNGIVDDDTVSIFYNGKLLLSHQRLSETALEFTIELDENITTHEITLYAENLGAIPPNTALIVVTAGNKRYELRSKANLEENAVLVIEYKPGENE